MLGSSHDRLTVTPARAARRRSAAILTSRFSRAAQVHQVHRTGSWKVSHHAASGSISEAALAANVAGTSSAGFITGVEQPLKTRAIDAASAAAATRPVRRSARKQAVCASWRVSGQAVEIRGMGWISLDSR